MKMEKSDCSSAIALNLCVWIGCMLSSAAQSAVTVASANDFITGLGTPSVQIIHLAEDIVLRPDSVIPGAPPSEIYELTRNVTISAPLGKDTPQDWYPILDWTHVKVAKISIPKGIFLMFHHVVFAHLGPFHSITVGRNGFTAPFMDAGYAGQVFYVDSVFILPYCPPMSFMEPMWLGLPRVASVPGKQSVALDPAGYCVVPPPVGGTTGQCWPNAFTLDDVAFSMGLFKIWFNLTVDWVGVVQYINTTMVCNQLVSMACAFGQDPNCTALFFGDPSAEDITAPDHAFPFTPPPPNTSSPPDTSSGGTSSTGVAIGATIGAVLLVVILVAALLIVRHRRQQLKKSLPKCDSGTSDALKPPGTASFKEPEGDDRYMSVLQKIQTSGKDSPLNPADDVSCSPLAENGTSGTAALLINMGPETGSSCSNGLLKNNFINEVLGENSPDFSSELYEMSRTMQTSIQDKQLHIQSVIGTGAFGIVYRGTWQGLPVAIKTVVFSSHTMGAAQGTRSPSVLTEAALSKSISHTNVVSTYSCEVQRVRADSSTLSMTINDHADVVDDWRLYIIQEFCDGGSLYAGLQRMAPGMTLSEPRAADRWTTSSALLTCDADTTYNLTYGIACGMSHLHERNVIHGDLNPANVLLKRLDKGRWIPKVCDFGFSVHLPANQSHVSNTRRGTPFYIAPEVLLCGKMSKAADVYAMGVMLWELHRGELVWRETSAGVPELHPAFPALREGTSPLYRQLVADCLLEDPCQRPTFPTILDRLVAWRTSSQALTPEPCLPNIMITMAPGTMFSPIESAAAVAFPSAFTGVTPTKASASLAVALGDDAGSPTRLRCSCRSESDSSVLSATAPQTGVQVDDLGTVHHTGFSMLLNDQASSGGSTRESPNAGTDLVHWSKFNSCRR